MIDLSLLIELRMFHPAESALTVSKGIGTNSVRAILVTCQSRELVL